MTPPNFAFSAKFRGKAIEDAEGIFGHPLPLSGITYQQELDWIFAAHSDQMSAMEFSKQPGWYQSMIVAAYRIERQIEAVLSEDRDMQFQQQQAQAEAKRLSEGH